MHSIARALLAASCLNGLPQARAAVAHPRDAAIPLEPRSEEQLPLVIDNSYWYDWGWYGSYPAQSFESLGAVAPLLNFKSNSEDCYDTYTLIAPRGKYVHRPAAVILDNRGDTVWIHTQHGQAMDLMVQEYKGKDYITFWTGHDNGTFGIGTYLMLDESYQVFKTVEAVGGYIGDLHEFRITERGTALMTIYSGTEADLTPLGGSGDGWIYDSIFQEVDIETGDLIFEWHALHHYPVDTTYAPLGLKGTGTSAGDPFDYFHINSIDEDSDGNFLISGRYMWAVMCISKDDGSVLWQLGGKGNDFEDLSGGRATDMSWNHHASWVDKEKGIISVFDNGSNGKHDTAEFSRGMLIQLDFNLMTATLLQGLHSPEKLLSGSQGSVQVLPNANRLVGWGHEPGWTEYSEDGEVLCDVHFGPVQLDLFDWVKNYRTYKFDWVGKPRYPPSTAMRPSKNALFVSWNGATEVKGWQLQSGPEQDGEFSDHGEPMMKTRFEMRLNVPDNAKEYVRVAALDKDGEVMMYSTAVSKHEDTVVETLYAPAVSTLWSVTTFFFIALSGTIVILLGLYRFRTAIKRGVCCCVGRSKAMVVNTVYNTETKYQPLASDS